MTSAVRLGHSSDNGDSLDAFNLLGSSLALVLPALNRYLKDNIWTDRSKEKSKTIGIFHPLADALT